ncbi:sugar transferase [Nocardioides sp. HDW12B]|uniref:sugar transferase n=1 Tax=Nocardioides sp. HDW12B TaxID=2714939 RepID=UPI0023F87E65|nr:sugar transferase [Nocardioides sp. HDW12B]
MKRILDLIVSLAVLSIASPIVCIVAISVRALDGRPVIFSQDRPGKNGKIIRIYKFRTMTNDNTDTVTKLGHHLRRTSLDELPQLVNILTGDLSLVGPRPLRVEYLPLYSPTQARRHEVRPGLTGWAQINGRNNLSWDEKFELDVWYVDNRSFLLDLKILALTAARVVRPSGIDGASGTIMEPFRGTDLANSSLNDGET